MDGSALPRKVLAPLAAFVAVTLAAVTGCGASGDEPTTAGGLTKLRVSTIAVSGAAAMVLGVKRNIFRDAGLDVEVVPVEAPAVIPSVVSGDAQIGFLNAPALLLARSNGVPAMAVSTTSTNPPAAAENFIQLQVKADSPIKSVAELEGGTIGVDTLYQLPHVSILNALKTEGVDVSKVKFVELPFPSMADALATGKVDAVNPAEPFVTIGLAAGARNLLSDSVGQTGTMPQSLFLASERYVSANKATVEKFRKALTDACAYARAHPDELRAVLPTYTKVSADLASKIKLPNYTTTDDVAGWQKWADILTEQQIAKKAVQVDGAFFTS